MKVKMSGLPARLSLPLLGQREYLQGTTLFDALLGFLPQHAGVTFKVPRVIKSDLVEVVDQQDLGKSAADWDATLSWITGEEMGTLAVKALPSSKNPLRVPYNESLVTDRIALGRGTAELAGEWPFSFCATIVSMNKAMLLGQVHSNPSGQWMFTRLDVSRVPGIGRLLTLQLGRVVGGGRIVKTQVSVDGILLGDLYFCWIEKARISSRGERIGGD